MIRPAKFADIPAMARLLDEMFQQSIYVGHDEPDMKVAKGLLMHALQRHGSPGYSGTNVMVADAGGTVEAMLVGVTDRVYHIGHLMTATDLYYYASPRAGARAAIELIDNFLDWAESNPKVVEICLGATNAVGDYNRTEVLYRRKGLEQMGVMYGKLIMRKTALDAAIDQFETRKGAVK